MSLGKNIGALMGVHGHTYADVAAALDTEGPQIHYLVKNESERSKFAAPLARFYRLDLALLLEGSEAAVIRAARNTVSRRRADGTVEVIDLGAPDSDRGASKDQASQVSSSPADIANLIETLPPAFRDAAHRLVYELARLAGVQLEEADSVEPAVVEVHGRGRTLGTGHKPRGAPKQKTNRRTG